MKKIFYTAFYFCSALLLSSCIGDLDQYPHEDETAASIYTSAANYKAVLGKIYTAMVTTGQEKSGDPDLSSNSGQDYMRCFFNLQECGTDEVASTWLSGDNVTGLTYLSLPSSEMTCVANFRSGFSSSSTQKIRMFAIDNQTLKHSVPLQLILQVSVAKG